MKALRWGVIAVAAGCLACAAEAQDVKPIGAIKTASGAAFVVSGQQRLAAVENGKYLASLKDGRYLKRKIPAEIISGAAL